jgi:hypothetical protein
MSRWLVTNVPAGLLLLGLIVVIVGASIAAGAYVRRRFPHLSGDTPNDVTKFAFEVVAVVFAFVVGFLASDLWGQISSTDDKVRGEGAAAVQLARDSTVFDAGDGDRIRQSLLDYGRAAEAEWPLAANGQSFPAADDALARLYLTYEQVTARTDSQKTLLSTSFANLDELSKARTERLLTARTDEGPPWPLWAVVILTSGLVLGCAIVYGVEKPRMHSAMLATVGALVAANVFLVLQLSHPFIGEVGTSPEPLREAVRVLQTPSR